MADRLRNAALAAGLLLLLGATGLFLVRYRVYAVPTGSMAPVITPGDRIVVDTWSRGADRGDIVLADAAAVPGGGEAQVVKRVAAVAGDRIGCCDDAGRVLVDGVPAPGSAGAGGPPFAVRVPAGRLFLLGDDPAVSVDSRAAASTGDPADGDGTVDAGLVRGRVVAVVRLPGGARTLPDRSAAALRRVCGAAAAGLALVLAAGVLAAIAGNGRRRPRRGRCPGPYGRG
ncbi:signal peptidase I [Actinoplanes sp. NPDC049668]|uniref:signal peptidase I n=1 Tax=unclassified Actinoplanes TaxID=2626549 RepID=UPI0033A74465